MQIDTSTAFGQRVARRLAEERVVWLVTVDADGTPQPSPVWFVWVDEEMLVYSQPNKPKLRNIERSPRVAIHLNSDSGGGDVVVMTGRARIDDALVPPAQITAYRAKYDERIASIGMTPEAFFADYSVAIRISPERLRGF